MPSLSLGLVAEGNAGTGVDHGGLLDDKTILGKTGDVAAAVGQRDLVDLVGVEPDLALTALEDIGREALLELERHLLLAKSGMGEKCELDNQSDITTRTTTGTSVLPRRKVNLPRPVSKLPKSDGHRSTADICTPIDLCHGQWRAADPFANRTFVVSQN